MTVLSWQIGAVQISAVLEMEWPMQLRWMVPDARPEALQETPWVYDDFLSPSGEMTIAVQAFAVESQGRRIVVDTCAGNDKPRDGTVAIFNDLHGDFPERMATAGFGFDSIDTVVCTHLHFDHVGWNTTLVDGAWEPSFGNARYLFTAVDLAHWARREDPMHASAFDDSVQPVVIAGRADGVEADHVITSEVRLIPTPGHSPGHASVWIESQGQTAVITGDIVHHAVQLARPTWRDVADADPTIASATRRAFVERVCDQSVLVLGTHFPAPTGGNVMQRDGDVRFVVAG